MGWPTSDSDLADSDNEVYDLWRAKVYWTGFGKVWNSSLRNMPEGKKRTCERCE